jgi:hypothetical protein
MIYLMEIFDYLRNILFNKKGYTVENVEEMQKYNPFLINRWVSMLDGESANIINETTNKKNYLNNDKEMHYKMLLNALPKKQHRKIEYIKKNSVEKKT